MIDLSITILSRDNTQQLSECIASILDTAPPNLYLELIVVDKSSTQGTASIAEKFPTVRIIHESAHQGYGESQNIAAGATHGRYILQMNDDMVIHQGALARIVRYLDENPHVGAAGCKMINKDGSLQVSSFLTYPSVSSQLREALLLNLILTRLPGIPAGRYTMYGRANLDDRTPRLVEHLNGAFFAVRRAVLDQVGLFDTAYYLSFEDLDWCWRIRQAGWALAYVPDAVVLHYGTQTIGKQRDYGLPSFYAGRLRFETKRGGNRAAQTLKAVILLELAIKAAVHGTTAMIARGISRKETHQRQQRLATAFAGALAHQVRTLRSGR